VDALFPFLLRQLLPLVVASRVAAAVAVDAQSSLQMLLAHSAVASVAITVAQPL
jgi:hypothetical protein